MRADPAVRRRKAPAKVPVLFTKQHRVGAGRTLRIKVKELKGVSTAVTLLSEEVCNSACLPFARASANQLQLDRLCTLQWCRPSGRATWLGKSTACSAGRQATP